MVRRACAMFFHGEGALESFWGPFQCAAPNLALVVPREARSLGIGRKPMQLVAVTQWVRARKAQVPPDQSRASRSGANPRAMPAMGCTEPGVARMQAAGWSPERSRVVVRGICLERSGRKPTVSSGRKAAVLGALWQASRTPPGSESGAGMQRGNAGTWERHLSPGAMPGLGDRATTSPGVTWGLRPHHEPPEDTTHTTEARKVSGSERQAK